MYKEPPFQVGVFSFHVNELQFLMQHYKKENIVFLPVQVKNKPHNGESECAFILGSMVCTDANT
jgi:hypothetical protein